MNDYFADLHIHIGRSYKGSAVKITASRNLTFFNILKEASERKGLDLIGIVDMHSPEVLEEVEELLGQGKIREHPDGGLIYKGMTVIMGSEVEIRFHEKNGTAHFLTYFPSLRNMRSFAQWLAQKVKNPQLSTQRMYASMEELQHQVEEQNGLLIPAHIFTPFNSVYGNCTDSIRTLLDFSKIPAVELGLSADSSMADTIRELRDKTFVTNSDAHSLKKIAREFQQVRLKECSFLELCKALWRKDGRRITANYGLNPKLGKYYLTRCARCDELVRESGAERCPYCGHAQLVKGVYNRLQEFRDYSKAKHPAHRPPYIYQVPLEFIPGLGPKKMNLLLDHFDTEMNILHHVAEKDLAVLVGEEVARLIISNRSGEMAFLEGGGGKYGKVLS